MKKLTYIFLIIYLFFSFNLSSQGLILSTDEEYAQFDKHEESLGFAGNLPASYSLEQYVPPVRSQQGGTCVGWSSVYYGLSTMYNIKFNITHWRDKYMHSFDPYFIYSVMENHIDNCDRGLNMRAAFNALEDLGSGKTFLPPFTTCNEKWSEDKFVKALKVTMPYAIKKGRAIEMDYYNSMSDVKAVIANDIPVIIGMAYTKSLGFYSSASNPNGVDTSGLFTPLPNEETDGGHAMCVVGYDDYKFGGAFRVVNSWGYDYGDNGYLWIRYKDFKKYVDEAFYMELNDNVQPNPSFKEGIRADSYTRYGYKNTSNTISTWEGQYLNNTTSGYAIWHDAISDTHYAGKFVDGGFSGLFFIYDDDGLWRAYGRNGRLEDFEALGFASDDDALQEQFEAQQFFDLMGIQLDGIRKSNSTSSGLIQKDEN